MLLAELNRGYRAYLRDAQACNASFDTYDLSDTQAAGASHHLPVLAQRSDDRPTPPNEDYTGLTSHEEKGPTFAEVAANYMHETRQYSGLAEKTLFDKQEALDLLAEITGELPVQKMTQADARKVKSVLLRLPKNRAKSARTSGLSVEAMLDLPDVERLAARTVNVYLGNMQTFFKWAVDNGHASENVFTGMRVKVNKSANDKDRVAFSREQMQRVLGNLAENPWGLVNKDTHKWGTLIAAYTGMRLNEVAQLHVPDVKQVEGVWLFDVTADNGDKKRLKNISSHRRVPVHDRLLELGLLDFVSARSSGGAMLFPDLPYSEKNGYGRNLGRWFNEMFLEKLNLRGENLVFHSLRHTVVTRLSQSDVPEVQVKALVGHRQSGVTYTTYFKEGFRPAQLRTAMNRLVYD